MLKETVCLNGGKQIDVIGQFRAVVSAGNVKVSTDFVIVKYRYCILGNVTTRELGVLYVGPNVAPGVGCNYCLASELEMKYPKVFQGVGKLKDFNLHLHVDQNVPPVAKKLRRVPFALREKVSAKIDEFLREDIIK